MNIGSTITMLNTTEEDSDGGRANKIIFKGEQSGGEESVLGEIQASHDGTADDQKGDLIFKTNDGSDGASPTERLRIDSDGAITASRARNNTAGNCPIIIAPSDTTISYGLRVDQTNNYLNFDQVNDNTTIMSMSTTGNVMIGTTTEGAAGADDFTISGSGSVGMTMRSTDSTENSIFFSDGTSGTPEFVGFIQYNHASNFMNFGTNATERMRIGSGGDVGIGTTAAAARLHVAESANNSEADAHFRIEGAGYSAFHWLDGTAYYIGQNSAIRQVRIYAGAETSGVALTNGATSFGTFSDERLKNDLEPINNGLQKLIDLRCVSYRLKDVDAEDSKKKLGVIAQDLVDKVDEVIDTSKRSDNDDTEYMSVRYTELIPVLIKAIQELSEKNDALEAQNTTQSAQIADLITRVAALEG